MDDMKRIAVLRWNKLPSFVTWDIPNTDELLAEDNLVLEGFNTHGFEAVSIVWNEPNITGMVDIALICSTWDYISECDSACAIQIETSHASSSTH
jgi:hypothetical protein